MENSNIELFKGIDDAYKYAVVYTQVTGRTAYLDIFKSFGNFVIDWKYRKEKQYDGNVNFFKTSDEAKENASILKSISNKKYINVHIIERETI